MMTKELCVEFPGGFFRVIPKDVDGDYPGIFVEVVKNDSLPVLAACVEYLADEKKIHIEAYSEKNDEPEYILSFEDGRNLTL